MNILIVDDDPATCSMLEDFVKSMHIEPLLATNGKEGLETFRKFKPSLVITDIMMPEMGGLELLTAIKTESPDTYVTVMTCVDGHDLTIEAFKRGASSFLPKPFRVLDLYSIIQKQTFFFSESPTKVHVGRFIKKQIIKLEIKTSYGDMRALLDYLMTSIGEYVAPENTMGIRVALLEMLKNAIEHGNLEITLEEQRKAKETGTYDDLISQRMNSELGRSRSVEVEFTYKPELLRWIICDQGKGFDYEQYLRPLREKKIPDLSTRGITTTFFQMDDMNYENGGRSVVLDKYL